MGLRWRTVAGWAREHRGLTAVLVGGALLRVATVVAYRPALFYSDSWGYLKMARAGSVVGIAPTRPSGYPLTLRVVSLNGHSLTAAVTAQHLVGLAIGGLVYFVLWRAGVARWVATLGAGLVVFDAYAVALEQHVLAESFFTLALLGSMVLLLHLRRSGWAMLAAGALLALAATMRPIGLFAAPIWLGVLIAGRPGLRRVAAGAAGLLVPLIVYGALHASATGTFNLTQADGWFLYGRIGQIARCDHVSVPAATRSLCTSGAGLRHGPAYYIFSPRSPARRAFGGISANSARQSKSNALLRTFALDIIVARPGAYAGLVAADFARFFEPGYSLDPKEDRTVELPVRARLSRDDRHERRGLPRSYTPHSHPPAAELHAYAKVLHTPRWLMALFALASLVALALRRGRARPVALLGLSALALLLGSAATAGFAARYILPVVPLLVCAGLIALSDLAGRLGVWALRRPGSRGHARAAQP